MGKVSQIIRRKKADPKEILDNSLILLSQHLKNLNWKVHSENGLNYNEIRSIVDTIKSIATLKDLQLKEIELDKRLKELESDKYKNMSIEELKNKIKKIMLEEKSDK